MRHAMLLLGLGVAACGSSNDPRPACDATQGGAKPARTEPDPRFIPTPTGACPALVEGDVHFAIDNTDRKVKLWIGPDAATQDGPLVFYWHGTGSSPDEAMQGLGADVIDAIKAEGGLVVAPYPDPVNDGGFPWFLTFDETQSKDDLLLADAVLACAIQQAGVDLRHIHAMGMSAGALNTYQMSWRRSGYLASVVTYSGGKNGDPPDQDPSNKFAAMVFDGGPSDHVYLDFKPISQAYIGELRDQGHFAFECDHGRGHAIPTDAVGSVWQFFRDHPFGSVPDPYACGLPKTFPDYCTN